MKVSTKRLAKLIDTAKSLPYAGYCVIPESYHYSDEWGDKLIAGWARLKADQVTSSWTAQEFRDHLKGLVIELDGNWPEIFLVEAKQEGIDLRGVSEDALIEITNAYIEKNRPDAFNLIPSHLYAEFSWVPGWNGKSLDDLMYEFGLRSNYGRSNYLEEVEPGRWLTELLKLGNCSSEALRAHCKSMGDPGLRFIEATSGLKWKVDQDANRPAILSPADLVNIIENGYLSAVPMFHCRINVRALFELDCMQPMVLSTEKKGMVHLGLHEGVSSGAGYMDTYPGSVTIPPDAVGFLGASRLSWGVDRVYGLVRSYFNTTPEESLQALKAAA